MAFTPATFSIIVQPIGGEGMRFFSYQTADAMATVVATGYFTNAERFGVRVSDLIFVIPDTGDPYIMAVETVDDDGTVSATVTATEAGLPREALTFIRRNSANTLYEALTVDTTKQVLGATGFATKADAEAFAPVAAPDFIRIAGYTTVGDGGGALYKKVNSEPSHEGKFSITLADGSTVVWFEISETRVTPKMVNGLANAFDLAATGQPVLIDNGYNLTAAISVTATADIDILGTELAAINYTGGTHLEKGIFIEADDFNVTLVGLNDLDGNNLLTTGLEIRNSSTGTPNCRIERLKAKNCRLTISGPDYAANGVGVYGSWDRVVYRQVYAENITREAGSGVSGSRGCQGVVISYLSTPDRYAKHIDVESVGAKTITTEDTPGDAAAVDCDGVALFQPDTEGLQLIARNVSGYNCQGRTIKVQPGATAVVDGVHVYRDIEGITNGSADVNVQTNAGGAVRNVTCRYEGATVHDQDTTPISFFTNRDLTDHRPRIVDGLTIEDYSTGAARIIHLVEATYGDISNTGPHAVYLNNIKALGNSIQHIVMLTGVGSSVNKAMLTINGFIGEVTSAIGRTTAPLPNLRAVLTGIFNTGSTVPVLVRADAASLGDSYGRWYDAGGNVGVALNDGIPSPSTPGMIRAGSMRPRDDDANSRAQGLFPLGNHRITAGASVDFGSFGLVAGGGLLFTVSDYGVGIYTTSGNTITAVSAMPSTTVSSSGSDPGSGTIRMWKTSSGANLTVKNADASPRTVAVLVIA